MRASPPRGRPLLGSSILTRALYAIRRAPCWTFRCPRAERGRVPDHRPPTVKSGSFSLRAAALAGHRAFEDSIPSRVVTSFRPSGSRRNQLPRGSSPLRRRHPGQPRERRGRPPPSRFRSQAFSASQRFPGTPELRGLVPCRCRPWGSPFRALILAGVACPSRGRLLPCSSSPSSPRCDARGRSSGFHRRPRPRAVAWIPTGARAPFRARRTAQSSTP